MPKRQSYKDWYKTLPRDKNNTANYNLRRAYELAPQEELDAFHNTKEAHLRTVYPNGKGELEFMKSPMHPTINKEYEWLMSDDPEAKQFRRDYALDTSGEYYKYVPRKDFKGYDGIESLKRGALPLPEVKVTPKTNGFSSKDFWQDLKDYH